MQQQQPCRLHIRHGWDSVQQDLLFLFHPLQMSCHEIRVPQRGSQHLDALLCSGKEPLHIVANGC